MAKINDSEGQHVASGDGTADDLPFPDKDISPALQRTLKKKLDRGENDAIPRKTWDRAMQRVVPVEEEPPVEE